MLSEVKTYRATCERCGHSWILKNIKVIPKKCPSCGNPYWNKKREREFGHGKRKKIREKFTKAKE